MFQLLVLLVILIILGVVARRFGGTPNDSLAKAAVRAGGIVLVLRLSVFWCGLALYTGYSGWQQPVGYALLIINSVVEFAIAAAIEGRAGSPLLVAVLIALTSAAFGWAWAWFRARSTFK
jgi:hypothetical protein